MAAETRKNHLHTTTFWLRDWNVKTKGKVMMDDFHIKLTI